MTTRRTKVDAMIAGMERKVLLLLRVVTIVADSDFVVGGGSKRSRLRQFGGKKSAIEKLSRQFGGKESAIEIDSSIFGGKESAIIEIHSSIWRRRVVRGSRETRCLSDRDSNAIVRTNCNRS